MPELWDPATGKISDATVVSANQETISLNLDLDQSGALFVIFRKPLPADWKTGLRANVKPQLTETIQLNMPWTLTFSDNRQMPDVIKVNKLESWHTNLDKRVKYYSGTVAYTTEFEIKSDILKTGGQCWIDLGDLYNIAKINLNGKDLGTIWKKPYRLEITNSLKTGLNVVEICVANTWINRLIGDEQLPPDLKYELTGNKFTIGRLSELPDWLYSGAQPKNRERFTFTTWKHYEKDSPLVPSGLLGPVKIEFYSK
jgi:hypothetical protein